MEEGFYAAGYKGSKDFSQWDVATANATGFSAAADDYAERGIDLNEQLIRNKPATFFMRISSDAMSDAGIFKGDVAIIDRSIPATHGRIVIAVVDGEMLIRRLEINGKKKRLVAASKTAAPLEPEPSSLQIWGVVTYVIHSV